MQELLAMEKTPRQQSSLPEGGHHHHHHFLLHSLSSSLLPARFPLARSLAVRSVQITVRR